MSIIAYSDVMLLMFFALTKMGLTLALAAKYFNCIELACSAPEQVEVGGVSKLSCLIHRSTALDLESYIQAINQQLRISFILWAFSGFESKC